MRIVKLSGGDRIVVHRTNGQGNMAFRPGSGLLLKTNSDRESHTRKKLGKNSPTCVCRCGRLPIESETIGLTSSCFQDCPMDLSALLNELSYTSSPAFLPAERFDEATEHAHVFRRACRIQGELGDERIGIRGVYLLREDPNSRTSTSTPVVYVAEATTVHEADAIHKRVWNQDIVPFLLVRLPQGVRLYSGFTYREPGQGDEKQRGVLEALVKFEEVASRLANLHASEIDSGKLFRARGADIDAKTRLDWKLLKNLEKLGRWLTREKPERPPLHRHVANALIGKFIYLKYLHERDILSDRKLERWGVDISKVFGRKATIGETRRLIKFVDCWLNGSIFPIPFSGDLAPTTEHLREVASVFMGDDYVDEDAEVRQLHLDFKAYCFSYIPIETLSVIYEQFLSLDGEDKQRQRGAYYTPIPLVNFMLAELEELHPLGDNTRILDPSCGSGAFLVQCYRRLIEREMRQKNRRLRPSELRDLVVRHIYGVDRDRDACHVAAMSLALTMLDNIDPPDLESSPTFKLPSLIGKNLFQEDFFDPSSIFRQSFGGQTFDWIVGNPPWVEAKHVNTIKDDDVHDADAADDDDVADVANDDAADDDGIASDEHVTRWMHARRTTHPVNGNQVAEAFAWEASEFLSPTGKAALLIPAMTLFKQVKTFRSRFFSRVSTHAIANFANLRRDLFRNAEKPAAALFFGQRKGSGGRHADVIVYSPLLINQETTRPEVKGERTNRHETWTITLSASEIRRVPGRTLAAGESLSLKMAMWGSPRDEMLLQSVAQRCPTKLLGYAGRPPSRDTQSITRDTGSTTSRCTRCEGVQLKTFESAQVTPTVVATHDFLPELIGKKALFPKSLDDLNRIYAFPNSAYRVLGHYDVYLRKRGGKAGLEVAHPPHVLIGGARNFAVFSDEFIVVPSRQIGIAGPAEERKRLIALSLYLNSDFAQYYEFFMSPQQGICEGRSTLNALGDLPFPFADMSDKELAPWEELHKALVAVTPARWVELDSESDSARGNQMGLFAAPAVDKDSMRLLELEKNLNKMVGDILGLTEMERWLVEDLVRVRRHLVDGAVGKPAVEPPAVEELEQYADALRRELDAFIMEASGLRHEVRVIHDEHSAMVQLDLRQAKQVKRAVDVLRADAPVARKLADVRAKMVRETPQWLHFDRNLFLYEGSHVFLLKPMQRVHWLRSQALMDADEIIAETLNAEDVT